MRVADIGVAFDISIGLEVANLAGTEGVGKAHVFEQAIGGFNRFLGSIAPQATKFIVGIAQGLGYMAGQARGQRVHCTHGAVVAGVADYYGAGHQLIAHYAAEKASVAAIVVGLPKRLDGSETDLTTHVRRMVDRLRPLVRIPIELQDERLSSQEAESRLALRERDWRARKARLDAASAAVILQDYLDSRATAPPSISPASIQD